MCADTAGKLSLAEWSRKNNVSYWKARKAFKTGSMPEAHRDVSGRIYIQNKNQVALDFGDGKR